MNNIFCCIENIKPIYNNIKDNDLFTPIKKIEKDYNFKFNYTETDKLIQNSNNDNVINYFIKSSTDISIIFIYPKSLKHPKVMDNLYKKLNKNGSIYYEKNISLSFLAMYNLVFQLYFNEKRMKTPDNILYKVKRIGFEYNKKSTIKVIVYKHNNKENPIAGNSSPFKMELRQLFFDEDNKTINTDKLKLYDYIHINNDDNQAYTYTGILFNENSLKFLEKQKSWKIYEMLNSIKTFNTLKKFLAQYGQKIFETYITFSSSILFSLGVREMNDIDGFIIENNFIDFNELDKIDKNILDITIKGSKETNNEWLETLDERAREFGAMNFNELVINPRYHYYFMGVKFLRLKYEIITRLKRGRPAQITDLLVLRQIYNFKYKLVIPGKTKLYNDKLKKNIETIVNKLKFLDTVKFYLLKRYYINLNHEQIEDWIYNYKFVTSNYKNSFEYQQGGNNEYFLLSQNIAEDKYIYPIKDELIKNGFVPNTIIYSDNKPFLYPGENFKRSSIIKYCTSKNSDPINIKNNTKFSIMTFNVHNFISRCNHGAGPLFDSINPYEKARDIQKFIDLFKLYSPTILCLQEIVPILNKEIKKDINDYDYIRENFNFHYLNKLMKEIGYEYKVIANSKKGNLLKDEDNSYYFLANAIYSKIPIKKYYINQFSFIDRNFIHIIVNYQNINYDIITCHFEYFNTISLNHPDIKDIITLQFKLFNEYLDKIKNNNTIICGDFNINLYQKQIGRRYNNYIERTKYIQDNYTPLNYIKIHTNFSQFTVTDYILLNKKSKLKLIYNKIIQTNLSDHYPIICYLL
jgi:endonuclease/exonuclease/phosphatase family metal-dependent hydrolase